MLGTLTLTLRCGHPTCEASVALDAGGYGSVRDRPKNLPRDWYWHDHELHGCPVHAVELRAAADAAYQWARTRTTAMNRAMKRVRTAHPLPEHPAWLARIWRARDEEI